jgi:putative FmdB family regulatory protein
MPIYEYRCSHCGHEIEALQKLSDPPLTECTHCHRSALVKLVSAAGFQLKGTGWYATDFKGSGRPAKAKEDAGASEGDSKGETKSESKKDSDTTTTDTKSDSSTKTETKKATAGAPSSADS